MPHAKATDILIRSICGEAELRAVENLQKEVWGIPDLEVVPLSQLVAAQKSGGVLLGAFDGASLVGFAYGFPSYEDGRAGHHSHMLAVKPEYRNGNLGEKLKRAQREAVLAQGIAEMSWTFDPLQSLNAYFNFNKLRVISDLYIVDFYGAEGASFLHRIGTDRLLVTWHLNSRRVMERSSGIIPSAADFAIAERLVKAGENNFPILADFTQTKNAGLLAIEIPANINDLQTQDSELAVEWRKATRAAFTEALGRGYTVAEFDRPNANSRNYGVYLLTRE